MDRQARPEQAGVEKRLRLLGRSERDGVDARHRPASRMTTPWPWQAVGMVLDQQLRILYRLLQDSRVAGQRQAVHMEQARPEPPDCPRHRTGAGADRPRAGGSAAQARVLANEVEGDAVTEDHRIAGRRLHHGDVDTGARGGRRAAGQCRPRFEQPIGRALRPVEVQADLDDVLHAATDTNWRTTCRIPVRNRSGANSAARARSTPVSKPRDSNVSTARSIAAAACW